MANDFVSKQFYVDRKMSDSLRTLAKRQRCTQGELLRNMIVRELERQGLPW